MLPDPLCTARGFSCFMVGISNRSEGLWGSRGSLPLALGEPPEAMRRMEPICTARGFSCIMGIISNP